MPPMNPTGQPTAPVQPRPAAPAAPQTPIPPMETLRLAQFLRAAAHNPETRGAVAEIAMRIDPNGVGKAFSDVALNKRLDAFEQKLNQRELQGQIKEAVAAQQTERKQIQKDRGYSDEQMADIEKTMKAKGVYSYRDGAILYEADNPPPPAEAPPAGTATWEFPSVPTRDGKGFVPFKDFQKDSKTGAYNAAYQTIDQFRNRMLPRSFSTAA